MTIDRRKQAPRSLTSRSGFTLVELIAVIIVVGILGGVAVSRFMGRSPFDATAFADQSAALLRYGQKVAVAQSRPVYVRITGASVALCYQADCASGARVLAPGGMNSASGPTKAACLDDSWACEAPPAQVTIVPPASFYFDPLGKPFAAADISPTPVSTFTQLDLVVKASESVRTITVEAETGYVH
jgi:MSHA pilin protein MshC